MAELTREQLLAAVISGRGAAYVRGVDLSKIDLANAGWLMDSDFRQANLSNAILIKSNLKGANFERANLDGANLSGANLEDADMRLTRLTIANLRLSNLKGANLQAANLVGANLLRANLESANLEGADLEGANLEGANLRKSVLNGANLKMANLRGANLEGTIYESMQELGIDALGFGVGKGNKNGSSGFTGSVSHVRLTDMIQLICLSRSDLMLQIESGSKSGKVHIRSGQVCHAEAGSVDGEEALLDMLQWENGRLETQPLPEERITSIEKSLEHLLIESLRRRDESQSVELPAEH